MKATATKPKDRGRAVSGFAMESGSTPSSATADRLNRITTAAYYKAEARGFMPGREIEDWLEAQAEFDEME